MSVELQYLNYIRYITQCNRPHNCTDQNTYFLEKKGPTCRLFGENDQIRDSNKYQSLFFEVSSVAHC